MKSTQAGVCNAGSVNILSTHWNVPHSLRVTDLQKLVGVAMIAIKPLFLLLAWFAGVALGVVVILVMFAPYFGSVLTNIGRRPVVIQYSRAARRRAVRTEGLNIN